MKKELLKRMIVIALCAAMIIPTTAMSAFAANDTSSSRTVTSQESQLPEVVMTDDHERNTVLTPGTAQDVGIVVGQKIIVTVNGNTSPTLTTDTDAVQIFTLSQSNGKTTYEVFARGVVGATANVSLNGQALLKVTNTERPFWCDTTINLGMHIGSSYVFQIKGKLGSAINANSADSSTLSVSKNGNAKTIDGKLVQNFRVTPVGNAGKTVGVYVNYNGIAYKVLYIQSMQKNSSPYQKNVQYQLGKNPDVSAMLIENTGTHKVLSDNKTVTSSLPSGGASYVTVYSQTKPTLTSDSDAVKVRTIEDYKNQETTYELLAEGTADSTANISLNGQKVLTVNVTALPFTCSASLTVKVPIRSNYTFQVTAGAGDFLNVTSGNPNSAVISKVGETTYKNGQQIQEYYVTPIANVGATTGIYVQHNEQVYHAFCVENEQSKETDNTPSSTAYKCSISKYQLLHYHSDTPYTFTVTAKKNDSVTASPGNGRVIDISRTSSKISGNNKVVTFTMKAIPLDIQHTTLRTFSWSPAERYYFDDNSIGTGTASYGRAPYGLKAWPVGTKNLDSDYKYSETMFDEDADNSFTNNHWTSNGDGYQETGVYVSINGQSSLAFSAGTTFLPNIEGEKIYGMFRGIPRCSTYAYGRAVEINGESKASEIFHIMFTSGFDYKTYKIFLDGEPVSYGTTPKANSLLFYLRHKDEDHVVYIEKLLPNHHALISESSPNMKGKYTMSEANLNNLKSDSDTTFVYVYLS
ncbi:MAG: hypothetical protein PHE09_16810 [Oscillospiraceae bacterium]|nr:hypothetical protein [Oscillospiraceae bacterium]